MGLTTRIAPRAMLRGVLRMRRFASRTAEYQASGRFLLPAVSLVRWGGKDASAVTCRRWSYLARTSNSPITAFESHELVRHILTRGAIPNYLRPEPSTIVM